MKFIKKYGVLLLVLALLGAAFFINVKAGEAETDAPLPTAAPQSEAYADEGYFESFRREREEVRSLEMQYLDEVISAAGSDDETLADAQRQKLALVENMETEFTIESLIRAKGYEDAAVTFHAGTVNVVVKDAELNDEKAAQLLAIVQGETEEPASSINIMAGE